VSDSVRDDIRTTSDAIEAHAESLADVERRKQDPRANDEELQRLAAQAEGLARRIGEMTRIEKKLVDRAAKS
jgi:hypothetical protein